MDTKKRTSKLQKSSGLFMQLGLVLILFTVYLAFEHETEEYGLKEIEIKKDSYEPDFYLIPEVAIEKPKTKKVYTEPQPKIPKQSTDITTISNNMVQEPNLPFDISDETPPTLSHVDIVDVDQGDELVDDTHLISNVQEVPIYPGCEKVSETKRRACFEKKISKHISRKFNTDLGNILGLPSGKKRINIEFLITKTGEIEITNTSAIHVKLEKEGKRIINILPKMIPGKHNGKEVNVKYRVPILFNVE